MTMNDHERNRPVTMKDVAKEAGLAVGTVSNYINGKKSVKSANRELIERAIKTLGYEVNEVARNLKMKSSKTVGVIIPSFSNVFAVSTISHLETIFRNNGYTLQVSSYNNIIDSLDEIIHSLIMKQVEGLIIMPASEIPQRVIERINSLIDQRRPIVVFDSPEEQTRCDHIVLNNYEVIKEATNRLLGRGHTHIALLSGPSGISSSTERLNAYIDALRENDITVEEDYILNTDYTKSTSRQMCRELLDTHPEVTAVLTAGYRITLGVLAAVNDKELSIPGDISVFGFDALDISDVLPYGLTGVYIPTTKVADAIAEVMLGRFVSGFDQTPVTRHVALQFIQGDSIA
mgnify:CR=1 FL=1